MQHSLLIHVHRTSEHIISGSGRMKSTINFLVLLFGLLLLENVANAETTRDQLKRMVEQLQQSPNDNALREKIIKFATTLKPSPAIPEEANRREGRGKFAFRSAKSPEDYLSAASEFEGAIRSAPWVTGYYSDLCTIYEKAEKYAEAKRNCELYLAGLANPSQISETKQRIAGLEFGIEKANSPEARATRDAAREKETSEARSEQAKRNLVGNWKIFVNGHPQRVGDKHDNGEGSDVMSDMHYRFEMQGDEIVIYSVTDADPAFLHTSWCRRNGGGFNCKGDETVFGRFSVDKNVIRGKLQRDEKSTDHSNTDLSGTYSDSEIHWVYAAYIYTYRETLRKQD